MFLDWIAKPVVLDVTLRDGGYLNNWEFSEANIRTTIVEVSKLGADMLELGYLSDEEGQPVASTWKPSHLEAVHDLKNGVKLAAMCRPAVKNPQNVVASRRGLIDFIRIPVDLRNTPLANKLARICEQNDMPYSFNLTGLSLYSVREISSALSSLSEGAAVVYLADSRGSLKPQNVAEIVAAVKQIWSGRIGFHAHDSLGLAGENTRTALDMGCELIDGSLLGIGLGGRNLDLIEALAMAKMRRKDLPQKPIYNGLDVLALGVPPNGDEKAVYYQAATRNIKMEWIALMIEQLGIQETILAIEPVPWGNWFSYEEIECYIDSTIWRKIVW